MSAQSLWLQSSMTYPPESLGVTVVMAVTVLIPFPPPVLVAVPVLVPVCVPVDEGAAGVDEGDKSFRQLESEDAPMV